MPRIGETEIDPPGESSGAPKYLTIPQTVASFVLCTLLCIGWFMNVQKVADERQAANEAKFAAQASQVAKLEYQAEISIADRREMRTRQERFELLFSELNTRLARIETKLDQRNGAR